MAFEIENGVLKKYREERGETEVVIPDTVKRFEFDSIPGHNFICGLCNLKTQNEVSMVLLDIFPIPELFDHAKKVVSAMLVLNGMEAKEIAQRLNVKATDVNKIKKAIDENETSAFRTVHEKLSQNGCDFEKAADDIGSFSGELNVKDESMFCAPDMPWLPFLADAFCCMSSFNEMKSFISELFNKKEYDAIEKKIQVAMLLYKYYVQTDIAADTGASSSLISEISYTMKYVGTGGYEQLLKCLNVSNDVEE